MAGLQISQVLVVFSAIVALNCISAKPRDIIFPAAEENLAGNPELAAYPPPENDELIRAHELEDKPKSCFHFYVSRNMSSLLAEATKMLRTIRDRREREWILTFIYRIKSLAEHLRAHPNSRNYDCLPTDEETKKRLLDDNAKGQLQPELYFVDDVPKRSETGEDILEETDEMKLSDNQKPNNTSAVQKQSVSNDPKDPEIDLKPPPSQTLSSAETASDNTLTDSNDEEKDIPTSKLDAVVVDPSNSDSSQNNNDESSSNRNRQGDGESIILSSSPDCNTECKSNDDVPPSLNSRENYFADAGNIYPVYQSDEARKRDYQAEERYKEKVLKQRIRKALLEELAPEIKKLKTVGGTEEDLRSIWHSHYIQDDKSVEENEEPDFDYEETGAAVGDLNLNDNVHPDRTVAPSLDEVQNSKEHLHHSKDSYEPYDDSDVLVQQLFDVRYDNNNPPSKSTKAFSDQNNEYLITSTHTPF